MIKLSDYAKNNQLNGVKAVIKSCNNYLEDGEHHNHGMSYGINGNYDCIKGTIFLKNKIIREGKIYYLFEFKYEEVEYTRLYYPETQFIKMPVSIPELFKEVKK
jgi:hypothetical protein